MSHAQHKYFLSFKLPNSYFVTLSFAISFVDAKDPLLLHVTREFHSVKLICRNLYAIIFPCEKSLYSQSEWRSAVFIMWMYNDASESESCIVYLQIAFQILAAFLSAPPSNLLAKAEESSRFVSFGCSQTCLYGVKKTRTHRANHREKSHC